MGDPYSSDPEKRPNMINRTWLDVGRHEENVRYLELELPPFLLALGN